jgi:hypothetical protein
MTEFVPTAKGSNIRFPSTANLYIDSADRASGTSTDFLINKPQNILTGFFTRLAVNEVVMDWSIPNVLASYGNNTFIVTVTGANAGTYTATLFDGFYTVKSALDSIVSQLNATVLGAGRFSIVTSVDLGIFLTIASGTYSVTVTTLSTQLDISNPATVETNKQIKDPRILNTKYIDIVSQNLTYNQDLKDASTAQNVRDVVFRWFLAWDNEATYDGYGFPILQGYKPFLQRRSIAFPKQIKWDNIQPIGQLGFQLYDSMGALFNTTIGRLDFNMCLLVSEV